MILYTSDLHFGHKHVITFDNRPFETIEEMDRFLIDSWNQTVRSKDHVYIVGDFCHKSKRQPEWYLKQLTGHKHLIIGNHDGLILKSPQAIRYFESVDQILEIEDEKWHIVMCHYPMAEWSGYYRSNVYHVHGHIHGRIHGDGGYKYVQTQDRALNAGCMLNGYVPVRFDTLLQNNRTFKETHPWVDDIPGPVLRQREKELEKEA